MNNSWPPPYLLQHSERAKRLTIKICAEEGLVITCPRGCSEEEAIAFLESRRPWVEKHQSIISKAVAIKAKQKVLPTTVELQALSKTLQVRYELIPQYRRIKLLELPEEVVLCSSTDNYQSCIDALINWLRIQGE